jgi:hypothetical protein
MNRGSHCEERQSHSEEGDLWLGCRDSKAIKTTLGNKKSAIIWNFVQIANRGAALRAAEFFNGRALACRVL